MKTVITVLLLALSLPGFAQTDSTAQRQKQLKKELEQIQGDIKVWATEVKEYFKENNTEELSEDLVKELKSLKQRAEKLGKHYQNLAENEAELSEEQKKRLAEIEDSLEKAAQRFGQSLKEMGKSLEKLADELNEKLNEN